MAAVCIYWSKARGRRDEARKLLANGADPGAAKQIQKKQAKISASNSFELIAREFHALNVRLRTDRHQHFQDHKAFYLIEKGDFMVIRYIAIGLIVVAAILIFSSYNKTDMVDPAKVHETNPSGTVKQTTGDRP